MEFTGWERVWIVLSLLLGVPSAVIAHDIYDDTNLTVKYAMNSGNPQTFWQRAKNEPALKNCIWPTARAQYWTYSRDTTIRCKATGAGFYAFMWFTIPGGVMWIIGATIGWIVSGFRAPKP